MVLNSVPEPTQEMLDEFEQLPVDEYGSGPFRRIRVSQYFMYNEASQWTLALLPKRDFIQAAGINKLRGGILRKREQLRVDPTELVDYVARQIPLDSTQHYHVNVNQVRVVSTPEIEGIVVAEGPHRDGHDFGAIIVVQRHNIEGGESQLSPLGGGEPFFKYILQPGEALVHEDPKMFHHGTNIRHLSDEGGYRDIWILAFNKWESRKYGPLHEQAALSA
ncbi:2OG-Fe dioxygenase family protein [Roseibium sp. M-1]